MHGVDPDDQGGHHAKVDVVDASIRVPALYVSASDLLFEFLENGLDFPTGPVILNELLDREGQVATEQGRSIEF